MKKNVIIARSKEHWKEYREMLNQFKKGIRNIERPEIPEDIQHNCFSLITNLVSKSKETVKIQVLGISRKS